MEFTFNEIEINLNISKEEQILLSSFLEFAIKSDQREEIKRLFNHFVCGETISTSKGSS